MNSPWRRLRTALIAALLIVLFFIVQTSVGRYFAIGGVTPNLMILLTASLSLVYGDSRGLVIGFFCGLLCDIFFSEYLGVYALIYAFTGYLCGKFERLIYPDDLKLPLIAILGSDFVYGFLCYVFLFLINGRFFFRSFMLQCVLPEMLYTLLFALPLYPLLLRIYQRFMRPIRESEKNFAGKNRIS
ncbi:rod shape-determining protein MreD [Lachnoclostridium sp. Marseille-P6806]|uniref:rod shape-determining protein MreD n=1 Tax=Lachnoclostridium sp. Marseille-P6806 TaxID=2364793 RepID=UPI001030DE0F|nr:rod shape-determining protein MreD [Lachnoclostridium sp. Marseille-P6806]